MDTLKKETVLIASKYGVSLVEESMTVESMGLDFQIVFADDIEGQEWVCRLPRREDVFDKIKKEKDSLNFISKHQAAFQVPVWEVANDDIILYKKLEGVPAVTFDPDTKETDWVFDSESVPDVYLDSLGQALAALHTLPLDDAEQTGFKLQTASQIRHSMKKRMDSIKDDYEINEELWQRWQTWVNSDATWPDKTTLIHGDLFPGHTLIDSDNRVTGMIDWTEAEVSDPSTDFTSIYMLFGEGALHRLIDSYKNTGGYVWPQMKEHVIERLATQALTIAEFARISGLKEYREMAQEMLKKGAES